MAPAPVDDRRQPDVPAPVAVRVSEAPKTCAEIYALERACLKAVKAKGMRGQQAKIEAVRSYNAAVQEAQRKVREPETQQSVIQAPEGSALATKQLPRGMVQTDAGLYVPEAK
jgi:hypothetical protein